MTSLPAPFGKYELIEQIGSGGMADVFLARSFGVAGFEKRLVIKRIKAEHARDPRFVSLFIHEAKIGVHLSHPNIVAVYELGKVGESWYIAMEHLHGSDLNRVVRTLRAGEQALAPDVAVRIIAEVCRGLAFAHGTPDRQGGVTLVHRDVSPHNIFVTFAGEVKLVDFGIARMLAGRATAPASEPTAAPVDDDEARPGGGKYAYMSPEQAMGQEVDHRTDIFSAGIVLWELLVGERLHQGADPADKLRRVQQAVIPHPRERGAEVDDGLWTILGKALAARPEDRYDSAAAFEEDLRGWLYERRQGNHRDAITAMMRHTFPDASATNPGTVDLKRLAEDLRRLDDDAAHASSPSGSPRSDLPSVPPLPAGVRASEDERKRVVALVVDVDGFTDISIQAEPEALFKRHLQLLRWLRQIVDEHGGTIQHVHDDQAYVFFGIPRTRTDDLSRALECAASLHRRLPELHQRGARVQLAIGLHTGDVTLGHAGSRVRYMARGDTTRLARRLSEQADHQQVLVSEVVFRAASGRFEFQRGPWLLGRGGAPPLASYLLNGRREGATAAARGPWLKRGEELEVVRHALVGLGEGRGAVVVVHGEDGCGKSRLVRELWDVIRRRRIAVYLGAASPFGHPLALLRELLLSVLGLDAAATPALIRPAAERFRQLGLFARDLEAIDVLLGLATGRLDATDLWNAARRVLTALAATEPVVVILEDVHNVPERELVGLAGLVDRLEHTPVLLLVTCRGEVPASLPHATAVRLGPLTGALQARLVASLLEAESVDDGLLQLVQTSCEGNPLYVEELLSYLHERQLVRVTEGRASLTDSTRPDLPGTLAGIISARLDALDPGSKGALQLAAIIGTTFGVELLGEVIGMDDPIPLINDLAAHGLIRRTEARDTWSFASDFVHQASLRGILGVQRRDYHRLVAAAMERRVGEGDDYSEVLAEHCGQGGRSLDGARYAYAAGRRREEAQELEAARTCYRKGLAWIEAAEETRDTWDAKVQGEAMLRLRLGAVCLLLGDISNGLSSLRMALDISEEAGLPWLEVRAQLELGRHYLAVGELPRARAHLGQAQALARLENDRTLEVEILEACARLAHEQGEDADAVRRWGDALARAGDDLGLRARCLAGLAQVHLRTGDLAAAGPLLDDALGVARTAGDRVLEGRILNSQGQLAVWRDEPDDAVRLFRSALQVREDVGHIEGVAVNHHQIGDVHFLRGDLTRAYVAFRRSRELAEEIGWQRGLVFNDVYLGFIDGCRGDVEGPARIASAVARAQAEGDHEVVVTGAWLLARLALRDGDVQGATKQLEEAIVQARARRLQPLARAIGRTLTALAAGQADVVQLPDGVDAAEAIDASGPAGAPTAGR